MSLLESDLCGERRWLRIGDFYAVTKKPRGLDRSKYLAIPFAAMEAIPQGGAYMPAFALRRPKEIASGTYFEPGDILVAKITPSFENGKQALIRDLSGPFGYATTEVIPIHRLDNRQDPRLLFFYLLHPDVRHYVAERMEGSTGRKRVPENVLFDMPIPSMQPDEQAAIADALESIQYAKATEVQCEQAASELKRAAMQVLFTRGMRGETQKETEIGPVPESWKVEPLEFSHNIISGGTPSRRNPLYWENATIPWVKTTEINYCVIEKTEECITQAGLNESAAKLLPAGTVLLAMYGQGVTRGKVAILGIVAACNQACAAIKPKTDQVNIKYLYHFLSFCYEDIRHLAHGGQQQNLNLDIVRNFPVTFPLDRKEQKEIISILDAIDRKIDLHRRKRAVLDELFKALLHKLMTGEIRVADLDLSALEPKKATEVAA
jgi:type I restriction enzyme S subunit